VEDEYKKNFLKAAGGLESGKKTKQKENKENNDGEYIDDGFLTIKKKRANFEEEIIEEEKENDVLEVKELEDIDLDDILKVISKFK